MRAKLKKDGKLTHVTWRISLAPFNSVSSFAIGYEVVETGGVVIAGEDVIGGEVISSILTAF